MPVDVAAGGPAVRGEAVVDGSRRGWVVLNGRREEEGKREREERKQRAQIMVGGGLEL